VLIAELFSLLGLSLNSIGPQSRYSKKLPAAATNQIAGNRKISLGMHKEKNRPYS
jgi:hypothetical protein